MADGSWSSSSPGNWKFWRIKIISRSRAVPIVRDWAHIRRMADGNWSSSSLRNWKFGRIKIISRSRAAVARWAHNPKVGSSILPFATVNPPRGGFLIMFTVYVLHSDKFDKIYVGYTSDLSTRIKSHNELATKGWTVRFRPWRIIHTEIFESKADAMQREKQLKTAMGREWIRQLISSP